MVWTKTGTLSPPASTVTFDAVGLAIITAAQVQGAIAQLDAWAGKRRNVADYGARGDGVTDDTTAFTNAIGSFGAAGGVLDVPAGTFIISASLNMPDNVWIRGAGLATVIKPTVTAFSRVATTGAPIKSFHLSDMTIDGINHTGTYNSSTMKGVFGQYLSNCTFRRLRIVNCGATGLGVDFLKDGSVIDGVYANGNGRLNTGSQPGGSGIGIGTGAWTVEDFTVVNSTAYGNKRYGIFTESQTGTLSQGARIVGCYAEANQNGYTDAGCQGAIFANCVARNNTAQGFGVSLGTISSVLGADVTFAGCVSESNGQHGFNVDLSAGGNAVNITITGGRWRNNTNSGINFAGSSGRTTSGITVANNDITGNGSLGVRFSGANTPTDITVANNRIYNNGQTNGSGFTQAIRFDSSVTRLGITGNRCFDNGSPQKQTYGIYLASGITITNGHIADNDLRGNLTGGASVAATLVTTTIGENPGYSSYAASSVTVNPAGLVVVTGTDVQAALAQLDAAVGHPIGPAGGGLSGTYPNPDIASGYLLDTHVAGNAAIAESKVALASDAAPMTPSRRSEWHRSPVGDYKYDMWGGVQVANTSLSGLNGYAFFSPFWIAEPETWDAVATKMGSSGAAGGTGMTIDAAVYDDDGFNRPLGALLATAPPLPMPGSGASVILTLASPLSFPNGGRVVWVAIRYYHTTAPTTYPLMSTVSSVPPGGHSASAVAFSGSNWFANVGANVAWPNTITNALGSGGNRYLASAHVLSRP